MIFYQPHKWVVIHCLIKIQHDNMLRQTSQQELYLERNIGLNPFHTEGTTAPLNFYFCCNY